MEETKQDIRNIITHTLESSGIDIELADDMSLIDSGILDSMSIVVVVQGLQDRFDVDIDFSDITLENFDSVDALCSFLSARMEAH